MEQMQYALPFPRENLLVKGMLFFFPSFSFLKYIWRRINGIRKYEKNKLFKGGQALN